MSEEAEKINLCRLKMDETFNWRGRDVCMALSHPGNIEEIVGAGKCRVISLSTLLSERLCAFPSASLSRCVGT